jgi:hypothetical protein
METERWRNPRPGIHQVARLRNAAAQLIENMAPRGGGMVAYVANEVLDSVQQALELLKLETIQRAVRATSVWTVVETVGRQYLRADMAIGPRVTRGRTGQMVLAWLADTLLTQRAGSLETQFPLPNDRIVSSSIAWLRATAELEDLYSHDVG